MTLPNAVWLSQPTDEECPAFCDNRSEMECKNSCWECWIGPRMKEIIGTVANGKSGLGLHPQHWWSKESTANRRKMVSEEIHHLEEVRHFATAVGQRKQGAWTKWENAKDSCHMEPKKLSFLIKAVYNVLPTPVNLHAWGLTTSNRCRTCGKTASLKHILTGCEYTLRSYTLRHNEILENFSEVSKTCCETANKALNIINNRAIQFVKEGNISKIARENMHKPSLLEGCTDWHIATNLKHNFIFPTEIALTTKCPDIVICFIKAKKVFVIELTVPYEENFQRAHQRKLEKYEDLWEQCVRNGWIMYVFSYWSWMQRFYCQLNIRFLN